MKTKYPIIIMFASLFFLSGCNYLDSITSKIGFEKKSNVEKQIAELKKERDIAVDKKAKEVSDTKDAHYAKMRENFQQTTNWTYGASLASNLKTNKNRLDNVLDYRLTTALSYSMGPTPEAIVEQNKLLKEELDESRVSNQQLAERYAQKEKEAKESRDAELKLNKKVEELSKELQSEKDRYALAIDAKEEDLSVLKDRLLVEKQRQLENAKSIQAIKIKASSIVGGLALLALAGAIWSPVFKKEFGIGAAILGLISVGIWFIEPWMVLLAFSICAIGLIAKIAIDHHREKDTSTDVYRAIQAFKSKAQGSYEAYLKPELEEWLTHYNVKTGEKVTKTDAIKHIDNRLMEVGDK